MSSRLALVALLLTTSLAPLQARAQNLSPLGGSTNNAGSPPPALATPAPAASTPATPAPDASAPAPAASAPRAAHTPRHARRTLDDRFAAANTTHDGKLTLTQAKAGHLRAVARDFAEIDKSKKGYVTLDEIKAHRTDVRAAHRAAREAKTPTQQ